MRSSCYPGVCTKPGTVKLLFSGHLGTRRDCRDYRGVLISGVEDVAWQSIENHLVTVACVHDRGVWSRGVSAVQGSGLEECLQFRIREVSAIQRSGLEGSLYLLSKFHCVRSVLCV